MATKGQSNQYGNSNGSHKGHATTHINFAYAREFMKHDVAGHFERHGDEVGATNQNDYINKAIKFANTINRKDYGSLVDYKGTTYKYDKKSGDLVIVDRKGKIISYYKVSDKRDGFKYKNKKGKTKWKKIKK